MNKISIADLIGQYELQVNRSKAKLEAILDGASTAHRDNLTADEDRRAEALFSEIDVAKGKLAELKQMQAEEAENDRLSRINHPVNAPGDGEDHIMRVMPRIEGRVDSHNRPRYDLNYSAAGSYEPVKPQWVRTIDGKGAAVERGQRFADHEIARAEIDRNAERDQTIVGQHGDFGQYIRAMTTSSASAIVPTVWSADVIDKARNASVMYQAGAVTVPMDAKTVQIGRLTTDPAPAFKNEGSPVTPGDLAYDFVQLVATSLTALVVVSMEFLQDAPNSSELIQNALAKAMALELDKAVMFGQLGATGTNDEGAAYGLASPYPKGILANLNANLPANVVGSFPVNGTAQTPATPWNEMLAVYYKPLRGNERVSAIVSNVALKQQYDGMYDTLNEPLRMPATLGNVPWLTTNAIPSYTRGTMTSRATDVFADDFSQVLIGQRLGIEIRVLQERYAENGQVGLLAYFRGDVQVARPAALACYRGLQGAL